MSCRDINNVSINAATLNGALPENFSFNVRRLTDTKGKYSTIETLVDYLYSLGALSNYYKWTCGFNYYLAGHSSIPTPIGDINMAGAEVELTQLADSGYSVRILTYKNRLLIYQKITRTSEGVWIVDNNTVYPQSSVSQQIGGGYFGILILLLALLSQEKGGQHERLTFS